MIDAQPFTPVLIVGAGPTGLTLAIELARRGVPFRIIDRDAERPRTSRAIGTQARTVEVFRLMGIPESALEPSVRPRALRLAERERTLARVMLNDPALDEPVALVSMDESDTERVLEERLAAFGGRVERGVALIGCRIHDDVVSATLTGPGGESTVRARFLVGADGAHSTVRQEAGIGFAGTAYPERFLLADLDLEWDLPHDEGHIWIGNDGLVAVIPVPGERRYRVIVPLAPAEAAPEYASEAEVASRAEELLRQRTTVPLRRVGNPVWASSFRIQRRQAERYRAGPVFLAGDAAHVHSPIGGQGMNLGIQDGFNLGWKLALAGQDRAAPGLLGTYEAERYPIAHGVLRGTHVGTRLVLASNPFLSAVREYGVPALTRLPPVRRQLLHALSQLGVGYRGSALSVAADDPAEHRGLPRRGRQGLQAGDRIPDSPLIADGSGERVSLFVLFARGWTLLLFPDHGAMPESISHLAARVRQVAETVGGEVNPFFVLGAILDENPGAPVLIDAAGEVGKRFGVRRGLVALVRPDGYLGYRGRPDQAGELASYLARVFAMRMPGMAAEDESRVERG